jgi:sugar phosphate isomerase/epimerase
MLFGICTGCQNAAAVKAAGWDYIEENVQSLLQPAVADKHWNAPVGDELPIRAANVLVPGTLKIVGPHAYPERLRQHMMTVLSRASKIGISTLVFGSGAARMIPEGFDRETASRQIIEFARSSAEIAAGFRIMIVLEPLNQSECNTINTVAEAMRFVKAVDHPWFQCLVDTYHFWLEDEPLENLRRAMPSIKHVHVADKEGRVAPGLSGKADYRPLFRVLKQGDYNGTISFEGAAMADFTTTAPKVLEFVKQQWNEAGN